MTPAAEPASNSVADAARLIGRAGCIGIVSHVNPDADAIGSVLGLTLGLRALGKEVVPALSDPVPEYARFLSGADSIRAVLPATGLDALICADAAGIDRIGSLYEIQRQLFDGLPVLNLDHHRTNPLFGTVNYVDPLASSTSELVFRLLTEVAAPVEVAAASALLFGIMGDTGSFRNGATTPGALQTASTLVALGGDTQGVAFWLFERKTFAAARLWGRIIASVELDRTRGIVFGVLSQEMLRQEGGTPDEIEGVAEYLRGIAEAEVVMLLKENEDGSMRLSMRSRPAVDVSAIAVLFGGGGHRQAAGCSIPGPAENARAALIAAYDRLYAQ